MTDGLNDDWEYEYSSTETEVHLVTLDLSLSAKQDAWLNPLLGHGDGKVITKDMGRRAKDRQDENSDNDEQALGSDDQGDNSSDGDNIGAGKSPQASESLGRLAREEAVAKEIQILELHSAEPVIAYGGRVFKGSWTENIGTELLFAEHSNSSNSNNNHTNGSNNNNASTATMTTTTPGGNGLTMPLPFARQLPHNVDLLGASTARIACTATELRRRQDSADDIKKARKRLGFSIPVTGSATEQRHKQAAFLENLMAIKHRRGEEDVVTVQATETKHNKLLGDRGESRLRRGKQAQAERYQKRLKRQHEEGDATEATAAEERPG